MRVRDSLLVIIFTLWGLTARASCEDDTHFVPYSDSFLQSSQISFELGVSITPDLANHVNVLRHHVDATADSTFPSTGAEVTLDTINHQVLQTRSIYEDKTYRGQVLEVRDTDGKLLRSLDLNQIFPSAHGRWRRLLNRVNFLARTYPHSREHVSVQQIIPMPNQTAILVVRAINEPVLSRIVLPLVQINLMTGEMVRLYSLGEGALDSHLQAVAYNQSQMRLAVLVSDSSNDNIYVFNPSRAMHITKRRLERPGMRPEQSTKLKISDQGFALLSSRDYLRIINLQNGFYTTIPSSERHNHMFAFDEAKNIFYIAYQSQPGVLHLRGSQIKPDTLVDVSSTDANISDQMQSKIIDLQILPDGRVAVSLTQSFGLGYAKEHRTLLIVPKPI